MIDTAALELKVKNFRVQLDQVKQRKATLEGTRGALFTQLKEKHGVNTVEETDELIKGLEQRKGELGAQIENILGELRVAGVQI